MVTRLRAERNLAGRPFSSERTRSGLEVARAHDHKGGPSPKRNESKKDASRKLPAGGAAPRADSSDGGGSGIDLPSLDGLSAALSACQNRDHSDAY